MNARDLILVSTLCFFEDKEFNDVIIFNIIKQDGGQYGGNLVFKLLYLKLWELEACYWCQLYIFDGYFYIKLRLSTISNDNFRQNEVYLWLVTTTFRQNVVQERFTNDYFR